jgi:hypothetical protein
LPQSPDKCGTQFLFGNELKIWVAAGHEQPILGRLGFYQVVLFHKNRFLPVESS